MGRQKIYIINKKTYILYMCVYMYIQTDIDSVSEGIKWLWKQKKEEMQMG